MELKYVLFDMDGVILDSRESILDAMRYTLNEYGKELAPEDEKKIIGPPLYKIYTEIFGFEPDIVVEAMNVYRKRYSDFSYRLARPFEEIPEMLTELAAHEKKLMLATARMAATAEFMLEVNGIREPFCYVGGLDPQGLAGTGSLTSKEDVIRHVLTENDIFDRECAVMIGDREEDILGGKANGLMTVGALYGFGTGNELAAADHLVSSPAEISRYIIENFE